MCNTVPCPHSSQQKETNQLILSKVTHTLKILNHFKTVVWGLESFLPVPSGNSHREIQKALDYSTDPLSPRISSIGTGPSSRLPKTAPIFQPRFPIIGQWALPISPSLVPLMNVWFRGWSLFSMPTGFNGQSPHSSWVQ